MVSENLSYKDFFTKAATNLQVKAPTKEASKTMLSIAWRLDWLRSKVRNKRRRLTKHTSKSITKMSYYSNAKLVDKLNYTFKTIDESLAETCLFFLNDWN